MSVAVLAGSGGHGVVVLDMLCLRVSFWLIFCVQLGSHVSMNVLYVYLSSYDGQSEKATSITTGLQLLLLLLLPKIPCKNNRSNSLGLIDPALTELVSSPKGVEKPKYAMLAYQEEVQRAFRLFVNIASQMHHAFHCNTRREVWAS